ncbi:AraC family transcriptional regulator [Devosia sp. Leaf64]|uniref:AraC family transcriptional regulator n=1 Tax=Devosia sp. Leaf64 TaxID=1736229 RepID=UPI00071299E7|nr:AraC family transcriptional regulator [Devosia sp. Leaf64]KQN72424.1 hypothetical protein ASE94_07895 [Devosia sp. Leaf64]
MIGFATDSIAPEHRFEHWRELRAKHVLGVTLELPIERRRAFQGRFRSRTVGSATVTSIRASAYVVKRTESDIARLAGNSICIGHQIEGPGHLETAGGVEKINTGDMTIGFSDAPFVATPTGDKAFHYRMTRIPPTAGLAMGAAIDDMQSARVDTSSTAVRPLQALFKAIHGSALASNMEDAAGTDLGRLALAVRGLLPIGIPEIRRAMRHGLYHAALDIMDANKSEPGLTPDKVAGSIGISRRQLFTVFEEAETSFAKTLSVMRIRAARQWLLERPTAPVIDIAFGCGFESVATFYRVFSKAYGMSPNDLRHSEHID